MIIKGISGVKEIKGGEPCHYKIVYISESGEEIVVSEGDGVSCEFVYYDEETKPLEIRGGKRDLIRHIEKERKERKYGRKRTRTRIV